MPSVSSSNDEKTAAKEVFVFPCSLAQRRLWFLHQLDPSSPLYNIVAPILVTGDLDVRALQQSLNEVVQRHESLRTTFGAVQGEPMQIVARSQTLEIDMVDLSSFPAAERESEIQRLLQREAQQPFSLASGPLLRTTLVRRGQSDHVLLLVMDHIISDGWSLAVLMREISVLYDAFHKRLPSPLQDLPIQYADFSEWQRKWLTGEVLEKQLDYWKQQLEGLPPALELPTDWPRTMQPSSRGGEQSVRIEAHLTQALLRLGRQQGATLFMVLLAAYQALLSRYTAQEDISVGSPIAGRSRPQTEDIIGFFVNTLVLRTHFSGALSFTELLGRVKEVALGAYAHQDVPFEKLVEVLAPVRDIRRTPLFQAMFILQNTPPLQLRLGSASLRLLNIPSNAKFELTLSLEESGDGIQGHLGYRADLFEAETILRMVGHYLRLLSGAVENPELSVATLPLLTDAEKRQLLEDWNGEARTYPLEKCVHELFEEHAMRMPNAIAVTGEEGQLTYKELNAQANQLARHLQRLGVGPEISVGILLEPSLAMMVAVLGILKAGGSYVPIDPIFPKERIGYILEDSQVPVLLTRSTMKDRFADPGIHVLFLDAAEDLLRDYGQSNLPASATIGTRVYTIYTSGSTGRPKGVVVEQRQILNYLYGILQRFGLQPGMQYAMLQPLAVDSSNTVFFPSMCAGGTLHTMPRDRASDPYVVQDFFRNHPIDVLKIAPSHMAALLEACPSSDLLPAGVLALGGEGSHWHWMRDTVQRLAPATSKTFIHYGPTETTVGMLTNPVRDDAVQHGPLVPLGRPLPNTRAFVLDAAMQVTPIGVPGEIYIGGDSVARGYLNRPDLTAERFVPDPFGHRPGARLYRTGDLGRWLPEGEVEFLGRTDHQVKIRGFRIELGEVESALRQHDEVERALAIARDDGATGKQLVAYVTVKRVDTANPNENGANAAESSLPARLRDFLKQQLPDYMVPTAISVLDAMPLGPQGKVDLRGLPSPSADTMPRAGVAVKPHTMLQAQLVEIWEKILNTSPVGVTDDFFQLGGHSLLAVRMIAMVRNHFKRTISLQSLFRNPTITHLEKLLAGEQDESSSPILVEIQPKGLGPPFFCVHPVGGNVLCYAELASALGTERPFYGLQSSPAGNNRAVTIEQMAAQYNEEIQRVQSNGPYLLGGWSMGGLVAFEMARQLRQQGKTVALVALFDTHLPAGNRQRIEGRDDLPILARFAADMARLMNIDISNLRDQFLQLGEHEMRKMLLETLHREGVLAHDAGENELNEMLEVFNRNSAATDGYCLRPSKQRVVLFHSVEAGHPHHLPAEWAAWADEGMESHSVATDHYGIMGQPHVSEVAERLRRYFDDVAEASSVGSGGVR